MNYLVAQEGGKSIRQYPQNYIMAWKNGDREWIIHPDLACDKELVMLMFKRNMEFEFRYCNAETLIKSVMKEYKKVPEDYFHVQGNNNGGWKECKGKFQTTDRRGHFMCDKCGIEITWTDVVRDNQH